MMKLHVDDAGNITVDENFNPNDIPGNSYDVNTVEKSPDAQPHSDRIIANKKGSETGNPSLNIEKAVKGPDATPFIDDNQQDKIIDHEKQRTLLKMRHDALQEFQKQGTMETQHASLIVEKAAKGQEAKLQPPSDDILSASDKNNKAGEPNLTMYHSGTNTYTYNETTHVLDITTCMINDGESPATNFWVGYYLSADMVINTSDEIIDLDFVTTSTNGFYQTLTGSSDLDDEGIPAGTYYVGVIYDDLNSVLESNENDNAWRWSLPITWVGVPTCPNLTVYTGTGSTNTSTFTSSTNALSVTTSIINDGTASSGAFYAAVYLSENTIIDPFSGFDVNVGWHYVTNLTNGFYTTRTITADLDDISGLTPGTCYYVGVYADDVTMVSECSETDNSTYFPSTICPTLLPNLDLYNGTGANNSYTYNATTHEVDVNVSIVNNGSASADAGAFRIGLYLSTNDIITTGDNLLGYWLKTGLASGSYTNSNATQDLDGEASPGCYYVGFIADYLDEVSESNEADNNYYFGSTFCYDPTPGSATVSGPASVCQSASATYSASAVDATSYTWTVPSGWTINSGQGTSSVNVTAGTAGGNVCATPSNSYGSGTQGCLSVSINSLPGTATVSGSASVCESATETYSASASNATSYNWTVPSGWTINSGQGTSSVSVSVGASSGSVCATPSNSCGDGTQGCQSVTVNHTPGAATVTGSATLCEGATASYSASATGATWYEWTVPSGWTINSGQGTTTVSVTAGVSSGGVCATPANSCGNGTQGCRSVTVSSYPGSATVTGSATVCSGGTETFTASSSNASSYTWTVPAGWTINSGQGTSSVSVSVGGNSGSVCATPSNSCGDGTQGCLSVTVNNAPGAATVSGSSSVCEGSAETYTASATDASSYTWTVPSGWTIISGQGTSSLAVTAGSNSGSVCATPSNSCGSGTQGCVSVSINQIPGEATISGDDNVAPGATASFSASSSNATSYTWTVPAGSTINSGQGTASIQMTMGSTSGDVCVTPSNSCGDGTVECKSVTASLLPGTANITGNTSACEGSSETYTASATSAETYAWTVPSGWTIISGGGTASLTVTVGSGSGSVCATPSNTHGSGTQGCLSVISEASPDQPGQISGEVAPTISETHTYSIAVVANADSYIWAVTGGTLTSDNNTASVTWTVSGAQKVSVKAENGCGESDARDINITVAEPVTKIEHASMDDLKIYPNPASDQLSIEMQNAIHSRLTLTFVDITGSVVYQEEFHSAPQGNLFNIDISGLTSGLYLLSIDSDKNRIIRKVVIE